MKTEKEIEQKRNELIELESRARQEIPFDSEYKDDVIIYSEKIKILNWVLNRGV